MVWSYLSRRSPTCRRIHSPTGGNRFLSETALGMNLEQNAGAVACRFEIEGELSSVVPHGSGHINDTYCATFQQAGGPRRFILHRINTRIFKTPLELMEAIEPVTTHV